jgi:hypothetical protein
MCLLRESNADGGKKACPAVNNLFSTVDRPWSARESYPYVSLLATPGNATVHHPIVPAIPFIPLVLIARASQIEVGASSPAINLLETGILSLPSAPVRGAYIAMEAGDVNSGPAANCDRERGRSAIAGKQRVRQESADLAASGFTRGANVR